jgi:hypothetical protein
LDGIKPSLSDILSGPAVHLHLHLIYYLSCLRSFIGFLRNVILGLEKSSERRDFCFFVELVLLGNLMAFLALHLNQNSSTLPVLLLSAVSLLTVVENTKDHLRGLGPTVARYFQRSFSLWKNFHFLGDKNRNPRNYFLHLKVVAEQLLLLRFRGLRCLYAGFLGCCIRNL